MQSTGVRIIETRAADSCRSTVPSLEIQATATAPMGKITRDVNEDVRDLVRAVRWRRAGLHEVRGSRPFYLCSALLFRLLGLRLEATTNSSSQTVSNFLSTLFSQ